MQELLVNIPFKTDFFFGKILLVISLTIILVTSLRLATNKNLIASIITLSVFSLFVSISYMLLDAPDVAMTETALGACLSTCVLLNVTKITGEGHQAPGRLKVLLASIICSTLVVVLCWASLDLPIFGQQDTPLQNHLTKYYIENTKNDIAIPSIVAAILASYRGFDTLAETTVILIAGLAVLIIISRKNNA